MAERRITATEARVHFGELLDSVRQNLDVVYVERAGVPQVVVVPVGLWELHKKEDPWARAAREMEEHWKYMAEARKAGRIKDGGPSTEEIIRTMREERSEQLLRNVLGQ
jgi:prevent-host-death family protein